MADAWHELRQVVLAKYRSVHAFCKAHPELNRSTVYQVLSGRYAGNADRQQALIRATVREAQRPLAHVAPLPEAEALAEVLQASKCARCRRPDRRGCRGCRLQTAREAQAVRDFLVQQR